LVPVAGALPVLVPLAAVVLGFVVVSVSGAAWPPVAAGVVVVCASVPPFSPGCPVVEVAVLGVPPVDGDEEDGADELGSVEVGSVSVGAVSTVLSRTVGTDSTLLAASLEGSEPPPHPATIPPPAPRASTARTAARRDVEMEEVNDITSTGSSYS
jgi:hypothetical protein